MSPIDPHDDDLARRLHTQLGAEADDLAVPAGDLDAVVARGRRRRGLLVGGSLAAVALVGAVAWVGSSWLLDDQPPTVAIQPLPPVVTPTPEVVPPSASPTPAPDPTVTGSPSPTPSIDPATQPTPSVPVPPTPTPAAPTDPGPTPDPRPDPTPAAPQPPAPTPAPAPAPDPAPRGDDVIVATDTGIVRGSATDLARVPGLDGPVAVAFDDGAGGIVFQRNDQGIGRLVDARISTTVARSDFSARTVRDPDRGGEIRLTPTSLRLMDVDAAANRMVLSVEYRQRVQSGGPNDHRAIVEVDLAGGSRREVAFDGAWEQATWVALGGPNRLVHRQSEAEGFLTVASAATPDRPIFEVVYSQLDDPPDPAGGQLDQSGTRLAYTSRRLDRSGWNVTVVDVATGRRLSTTPVADLTGDKPAVVSDFDDDRVIVVGTGGQGQGQVSVVEGPTGSTTPVTGRAVFTR